MNRPAISGSSGGLRVPELRLQDQTSGSRRAAGVRDRRGVLARVCQGLARARRDVGIRVRHVQPAKRVRLHGEEHGREKTGGEDHFGGEMRDRSHWVIPA